MTNEEVFDEEILQTAVTRRPFLAALAKAPKHRQELQEELDVSKTTCHRVVRAFDEHGLLKRTDSGYSLTEKGTLLEMYVDEYRQKVRAAFLLEPLIEAFGSVAVDFDIELFADARITRPDSNDPTLPFNREFELFREANQFSAVDGNQHIPTPFLERVYEMGIEKGMKAELIAPKPIVKKRLSMHPDLHKRHSEVDAQLTYQICDEVPFGVVVYDHEHAVVRAYDDDTGSVELMMDSDDPAAVSWAENVLDHYRQKADPPSEFDGLPDWTPSTDVEP